MEKQISLDLEKDICLAKQVAQEEYLELIEAYEKGNLYEYFFGDNVDLYGISWVLTGWDLKYSGVRVMTSFGGPNVWIDTDKGALICGWGHVEYVEIRDEIIEAIDDIFEDVYLGLK